MENGELRMENPSMFSLSFSPLKVFNNNFIFTLDEL
jgi:hypothetical protein